MDFGIAEKYNGTCNLRFDDTNPVKEDVEYVDSITEDIKWLGFKWQNIYYASDYVSVESDMTLSIGRIEHYIDYNGRSLSNDSVSYKNGGVVPALCLE